MALLTAKAGRVPPATAPFHHIHDAYNFAAELGVWAPIVTLLALTTIAGYILWSKVAGY